jgi:hypothetical protein
MHSLASCGVTIITRHFAGESRKKYFLQISKSTLHLPRKSHTGYLPRSSQKPSPEPTGRR